MNSNRNGKKYSIKPHGEMIERFMVLDEKRLVTELCANCPDFRVEAPLPEARDAFRVHVTQAHPHLLPKLDVKRRPGIVKTESFDRELYLVRLLEMWRVAAA